MFKQMTNRELRSYIDGCHAAREYDAYFEAACREWNDRRDGYAHIYRRRGGRFALYLTSGASIVGYQAYNDYATKAEAKAVAQRFGATPHNY